MLGNDFPQVWEASVTDLDSVPVDEGVQGVFFREVVIYKLKKFCSYVCFDITGEGWVEPGYSASPAFFLVGGLGGGEGWFKI